MIYQFENEEIKRCRECPCHSWADFPDEKDWCDLQDKQLAYDTEPEYNDCPLVAISKTETTGVVSDGFSYDAKPKQYQCLGCRDYFYMPRVGNYCPNCGRRLACTE